MKCANCGAENPDDMVYCSKCAERISEPEPSTNSQQTSPDSEDSTQTTTLRLSWSLGSSPFSKAVIVLAVGLVLLVVGLILQIYYYEQWIGFHRGDISMNELDSLRNIERISGYAADFGDIATVVGLVFIIQGVVLRQWNREGFAWLGQTRLTKVKWLLVLAVAFLTIAPLVRILYEVNFDVGYDMLMRIYYFSACSWVLATAAFLLIAVEFRKAAEAA
jgi:hypothetical protein